MAESFRDRWADRLDAWEVSLQTRAFRLLRPREIFFVVERVPSIGWCILSQHKEYVDAYDCRNWLPNNQQTRVMTRTEWQRRTLTMMASRQPWIALSTMAADLHKLRSELANERAMSNTGVLSLYADPGERQR